LIEVNGLETEANEAELATAEFSSPSETVTGMMTM
jgi:hypothetical protein